MTQSEHLTADREAEILACVLPWLGHSHSDDAQYAADSITTDLIEAGLADPIAGPAALRAWPRHAPEEIATNEEQLTTIIRRAYLAAMFGEEDAHDRTEGRYEQ